MLRHQRRKSKTTATNKVLAKAGLTEVIQYLCFYQLLCIYSADGFQMPCLRQYPNRWVKPANSIIFFLTALYAAQKKSGSGRPEMFDAAYLMTRYKHEYDLPELPSFVKKVIMPTTYLIGLLLGKYKKFEGAPEPLK